MRSKAAPRVNFDCIDQLPENAEQDQSLLKIKGTNCGDGPSKNLCERVDKTAISKSYIKVRFYCKRT
jgi:hypothetical protein